LKHPSQTVARHSSPQLQKAAPRPISGLFLQLQDILSCFICKYNHFSTESQFLSAIPVASRPHRHGRSRFIRAFRREPAGIASARPNGTPNAPAGTVLTPLLVSYIIRIAYFCKRIGALGGNMSRTQATLKNPNA